MSKTVHFNMRKNVKLTLTVRFLPKLPKKSGKYLVCFDYASGTRICVEDYSAKTKRFYFVIDTYENGKQHSIYNFDTEKVLWWIDINDLAQYVQDERLADLKKSLIDINCSAEQIAEVCEGCLKAAKDYARETLIKRGDIND